MPQKTLANGGLKKHNLPNADRVTRSMYGRMQSKKRRTRKIAAESAHASPEHEKKRKMMMPDSDMMGSGHEKKKKKMMKSHSENVLDRFRDRFKIQLAEHSTGDVDREETEWRKYNAVSDKGPEVLRYFQAVPEGAEVYTRRNYVDGDRVIVTVEFLRDGLPYEDRETLPAPVEFRVREKGSGTKEFEIADMDRAPQFVGGGSVSGYISNIGVPFGGETKSFSEMRPTLRKLLIRRGAGL